VTGKATRRGVWTLKPHSQDADQRPTEAEVEVVVDYDALKEVIRRVVWQAMTSKRGQALFHHGLVRAKVLRRGRVG
jgi:hypothetical protein